MLDVFNRSIKRSRRNSTIALDVWVAYDADGNWSAGDSEDDALDAFEHDFEEVTAEVRIAHTTLNVPSISVTELGDVEATG